ncbi:hypothetical protein LTR28_009055, partial [Elasticomyces elasticus]
MRLRHSLLAIAASLLAPALAVFADDAYSIDYHYALLGRPRQHSTFFHRPQAGSKASLLYTLSDQGVLGAVNPKDGNLVWRQVLDESGNSTAAFLRAGEGSDVVISACAGQIAAWSAADGRLSWRIGTAGAEVKDLEVLELDEGRGGAELKDAVVLLDGVKPSVRRLDARTGQTKWEFEESSGDTPWQVSASSTNVYLISLHSTLLGRTQIKVSTLDALNGHKTDQYTLSSESELDGENGILSVGANAASPIIAWTDSAFSVLKINVIGVKGTTNFKIENTSGEDITK